MSASRQSASRDEKPSQQPVNSSHSQGEGFYLFTKTETVRQEQKEIKLSVEAFKSLVVTVGDKKIDFKDCVKDEKVDEKKLNQQLDELIGALEVKEENKEKYKAFLKQHLFNSHDDSLAAMSLNQEPRQVFRTVSIKRNGNIVQDCVYTTPLAENEGALINTRNEIVFPTGANLDQYQVRRSIELSSSKTWTARGQFSNSNEWQGFVRGRSQSLLTNGFARQSVSAMIKGYASGGAAGDFELLLDHLSHKRKAIQILFARIFTIDSYLNGKKHNKSQRASNLAEVNLDTDKFDQLVGREVRQIIDDYVDEGVQENFNRMIQQEIGQVYLSLSQGRLKLDEKSTYLSGVINQLLSLDIDLGNHQSNRNAKKKVEQFNHSFKDAVQSIVQCYINLDPKTQLKEARAKLRTVVANQAYDEGRRAQAQRLLQEIPEAKSEAYRNMSDEACLRFTKKLKNAKKSIELNHEIDAIYKEFKTFVEKTLEEIAKKLKQQKQPYLNIWWQMRNAQDILESAEEVRKKIKNNPDELFKLAECLSNAYEHVKAYVVVEKLKDQQPQPMPQSEEKKSSSSQSSSASNRSQQSITQDLQYAQSQLKKTRKNLVDSIVTAPVRTYSWWTIFKMGVLALVAPLVPPGIAGYWSYKKSQREAFRNSLSVLVPREADEVKVQVQAQVQAPRKEIK